MLYLLVIVLIKDTNNLYNILFRKYNLLYIKLIMFYKGIIFDLDDTLYDYEYTHNLSIKKCFSYLNEIHLIDLELLNDYYKYIYLIALNLI